MSVYETPRTCAHVGIERELGNTNEVMGDQLQIGTLVTGCQSPNAGPSFDLPAQDPFVVALKKGRL